MNKIICIGSCCNPKKNSFTGQSVMFDGIVNHLKQTGSETIVVDLAQKAQKNGTIFRVIDYFLILLELLLRLCMNRCKLSYLVTAQSKFGFYRDYTIISMCRWFDIPVITHQYGANYRRLIESLNDKGLRKLKKMYDYVSTVICEGDYMKEQFSFIPDYKTKVKVIPNGLPVEGKNAQREKKYDGKEPFRLIYLSNLIYSKGYFDVLKAVDILVNHDHLNVKCVFAGKFLPSSDDDKNETNSKEVFDQYIEEHHLSDKIEYYQGLYGEDKDEFFCKSNVFLLPTYYINEGQPVSIIDAMSYGCVSIVTKYRHIPMMINENNGCFVEPKNPLEIADKIKYLMLHPDIYASKSRQSILDYQQKFKFDVYASRVMECFNAVISR